MYLSELQAKNYELRTSSWGESGVLSQDVSSPAGWRQQLRLTGRGLFLIAVVGWISAMAIVYLLVWQPTYAQVRLLDSQKEHLLSLQSTQLPPQPKVPTFNRLPAILDNCARTFRTHAVTVTGLNVERFAQPPGKTTRDILDYAFVRLQLRGSWRDIADGIAALEGRPDLAVHVREAKFNAKDSQVLLQIYFAREAIPE